MNERIKELAEQANAHKLDWAYYRGEKKPENAVTLHSVDLELFAELIVQECIEQFAFSVTDNTEIIQDRFAQCRKVAKHFGVE